MVVVVAVFFRLLGSLVQMGCEVVFSGKLRPACAKSMKFVNG